MSECTSPYFTGMVSVIQPSNSWVAKWQRIIQKKPGVYALEVTDTIVPGGPIHEFLEGKQILRLAKPYGASLDVH